MVFDPIFFIHENSQVNLVLGCFTFRCLPQSIVERLFINYSRESSSKFECIVAFVSNGLWKC